MRAWSAGYGPKGLLGDSGYLLGARLISILANIVIAPVFINELGLTNYGIWALATVVFNYLTLVDLGMHSAVVRIASDARAKGDRRAIFRVAAYAWLLYIVLSILALMVLAVVIDPLLNVLSVPTRSQGAAAILFNLTILRFFLLHTASIVLALLVSVGMIRLSAVLTGMGHAAYGVVVILALKADSTLPGVGLAALVQGVPSLLGGCIILPGALARVAAKRGEALRTSRSLRKELFAFGGWLQVTNVANAINTQTDAIVLAILFGPSLTGRYELANRLALPVRMAAQPLLEASYPRMAGISIQSEGQEELRKLSDYAWQLFFTTVLAATAYIYIAAPHLLQAWLGKDVPGATFMARALVIAVAASMLSGIASTVFRANGLARVEGKVAIASAGINVGLSVLLGYVWGWHGVIVASVVVAVLHSVVIIVSFRRIYGGDRFRHFQPSTLRHSAWVAGSTFASVALINIAMHTTPELSSTHVALLAALPFAPLAKLLRELAKGR